MKADLCSFFTSDVHKRGPQLSYDLAMMQTPAKNPMGGASKDTGLTQRVSMEDGSSV